MNITQFENTITGIIANGKLSTEQLVECLAFALNKQIIDGNAQFCTVLLTPAILKDLTKSTDFGRYVTRLMNKAATTSFTKSGTAHATNQLKDAAIKRRTSDWKKKTVEEHTASFLKGIEEQRKIEVSSAPKAFDAEALDTGLVSLIKRAVKSGMSQDEVKKHIESVFSSDKITGLALVTAPESF